MQQANRACAPSPQPSGAEPLVFVPHRRRALGVGAAIGAGAALGLGLGSVRVASANAPADMRPQPGDVLIHRFGPKEGGLVMAIDVPSGAELIQAFSKDAASGVVRDGSRLNGINLVRLPSASITPEHAKMMAGDVIAFSSVCTHQGCDLTQWIPEETRFKCFCHHSEFDAVKFGEVVGGPAQRSLAILPVAQDPDGHLVVASAFRGKVGFKA